MLGAMPRGVKLAYTDDSLREAVAAARSWREVLQILGYQTTNGALSKAIRHRAEALEINSSHFVRSGRVSWTDGELCQAIRVGTSWNDVVCRLGITPDATAIARADRRARQLQIDVSHLGPSRTTPAGQQPVSMPALPARVRQSTNSTGTRTEGVVLAALLRAGYNVLLPFGVARYDLLIEDANGRFHRVQCKTGRLVANGSSVEFNVRSSGPGTKPKPYVEDAEYFGVYLADLDEVYLVPIGDVAHLTSSARLQFRSDGAALHASRYRLVA